MFWMIIVITLTGSIVVGSLITAYFYTSNPTTQQTASVRPLPCPCKKEHRCSAKSSKANRRRCRSPSAHSTVRKQFPASLTVRVVIDKSGQVTEAQASGGDWLLRGAASEAALKSTFAPEKLRGRETEGTITYTFEP